MSKLIVHAGGKEITRDELDLIPVPAPTESYIPVPHYQLATTLATIGQDLLKGYSLTRESFAVAREGNQFFGVLTFTDNRNDEMGLSLGFRNSYDKSMSIGICIGARVFVCDNMAFSGDITIMKKHTLNVWQTLENTAIATLYRANNTFDQIVCDKEMLAGRAVIDNEAFKMLGLLWGNGILSPRQLAVARDEWLKPKHQDFEKRNAWSLYNACTEALKSTPPLRIMEAHTSLHDTMTLQLKDGVFQ